MKEKSWVNDCKNRRTKLFAAFFSNWVLTFYLCEKNSSGQLSAFLTNLLQMHLYIGFPDSIYTTSAFIWLSYDFTLCLCSGRPGQPYYLLLTCLLELLQSRYNYGRQTDKIMNVMISFIIHNFDQLNQMINGKTPQVRNWLPNNWPQASNNRYRLANHSKYISLPQSVHKSPFTTQAKFLTVVVKIRNAKGLLQHGHTRMLMLHWYCGP